MKQSSLYRTTECTPTIPYAVVKILQRIFNYFVTGNSLFGGHDNGEVGLSPHQFTANISWLIESTVWRAKWKHVTTATDTILESGR
jgi:hypothetical protein